MKQQLSKRQEDILAFIRQEVHTKGYPPSVREIGDAVGLSSSSTVHGYLRKLEESGYIRRDPTKPRAIELLGSDGDQLAFKETRNVPIVGNVTAGAPILAVENIDDYFPIPKDFSDGEDLFMLRIQGESMIEAGIFDGDLVLVEKRSVANDGDIVVALVGDEEATVKRYFNEGTHIRLQPENSAMQPIIGRDISILGKVRGVFRKVY